METGQEIIIRPYQKGDREKIRALCCETAFGDLGSQAFFEDGGLFADYFTRYYTDFEPESALVAYKDGQLCAYLTGCRDTRRFVRTMSVFIMGPLLLKLAANLAAGRYKKEVSRRFLRWLALYSWREAPPIDTKTYPVHYHCNVAKGFRRLGLYSTMGRIFLEKPQIAAQKRIHGSFLEPAQKDTFGRMFARFPGQLEYRADKASTLFSHVLGDETPMKNSVYGGSIPDFCRVLERMAKYYRI
ncbi:MAG: hypothetical protein QMD09_01580 [Desulfatibacillaceae bacterium]|nr:hypothetical protein [Desulfatibacillaceae bacterium]